MSSRPQSIEEYRTYFFGVINREMGHTAPDWVEVLTNSGIPAGLPPYERVSSNAPFYGLTQQVGAGGVRGRLFLPTTQPDSLGYYTHPFDVLSGPQNALVWAWNDVGGPPVDFNAGTGTDTDGGTDTGGDNSDYEARISQLEEQVGFLSNTVNDLVLEKIGYGARIGLRMSEGQVLSAQAGGGTEENKPVELQTRQNVGGAWEIFIVEQP